MALDREVVVVGAGVAGLSAAAALAGDGAKVTLLERRAFVGGRAYSYEHPALGEVVDSQHVLLGCCTNLIEFCEEAGLADKIRWYDRQTFLTPDGTTSTIEAGSLPAPLQYTSSFLHASMLTAGDKVAIARGLMHFARGNSGSDEESAAQWYKRTGQTERAIRHFWEPVLLATLNDNAENCSMKYAGKVFYELFLKTSTGGRLGIPTVPLSEFYGAGAEMIRRMGANVELRAGVERIERQADGSWLVRTPDAVVETTNVVVALPFGQTQQLITGMGLVGQEDGAVRAELLGRMANFVASPFISVLLWYDRQITDLDHAWLLDTTIQWFFHKSRIRRYPPEQGSYVELVIAGSKRELAMPREEILATALAEVERFFPAVRRARLLKSGLLKEARATFSVTPGLDAYRPSQKTALPGLYLAGDWTATEWPATMEGASRSGRLAAGEVAGDRMKYLTPDLAPTGLMRWLATNE
jgi:squalene-associated FAD-dependent desaturase